MKKQKKSCCKRRRPIVITEAMFRKELRKIRLVECHKWERSLGDKIPVHDRLRGGFFRPAFDFARARCRIVECRICRLY